FEAEQINLKIAPGGPNVDGVNVVASGSAQAGNLSSSPSLMLARAGGIPIKCFAVGYQEHPFTYFSLPKNPIRTPKDMVGKKIGTQGTARILLRALLAKHKINASDVKALIMGSDMLPLLTGQVDAVTGRPTKTTAAKGWGTMEPAVWEQQLRVYEDLQQFKGAAPKVADVMTDSILQATAGARPKIG